MFHLGATTSKLFFLRSFVVAIKIIIYLSMTLSKWVPRLKKIEWIGYDYFVPRRNLQVHKNILMKVKYFFSFSSPRVVQQKILELDSQVSLLLVGLFKWIDMNGDAQTFLIGFPPHFFISLNSKTCKFSTTKNMNKNHLYSLKRKRSKDLKTFLLLFSPLNNGKNLFFSYNKSL